MKYKIKQGVLAVLCVVSLVVVILLPSAVEGGDLTLGAFATLELICIGVFTLCGWLGGWMSPQEGEE